MPSKKREVWNKLEYYLITLGALIGFGCVWRFPYLLYENGGAIFLIPTIISLFTMVLPLMTVEIGIGQYFKKPLHKIYSDFNKKYIGNIFVVILTAFMIMSFYIYLMAYCVIFIFLSIFGDMEFLNCKQELILEKTSDYFRNYILELDLIDDKLFLGGFNYKIFTSFIFCWIIIYFSIWKGIKVSGKIAKVTVLSPYLILTILLTRSFFLPGFQKGLKYLFIPDLKKLFNIKTWYVAIDQNFFQNNLGYGGIVLFSTFRQRKDKVYKSVKFITIASFLTGILASLVVFSYLGYFSHISNTNINELPIEGADLVFVTYPAALSHLPLPRFWIFLFFLNLIFLGIDTLFALAESCGYYLIDFNLKFRNKKIKKYILRFFVVFTVAFLSVFLSFRKGFDIIKFINEYIFFLPASFTAFINFYVFFKKGFFQILMTKLKKYNNEDIPNYIFFLLDKIVPFCFLFIFIGFFCNIKSIYYKFGSFYFFIGTFVIFLIISPFFAFYWYFKDSPDGTNFDIDIKDEDKNKESNDFSIHEEKLLEMEEIK